jgi:D-glycero-D-manno-heptose 1,7-bisphosphate phosphatase
VKTKPALFLDRDGVIIKSYTINGKPFPPRSLDKVLLLDDVVQSVNMVKNFGFEIVVITNQPDIATGKTTIEFLNQVHEIIKDDTGINKFYICPHTDKDYCNCRKPKPGLFIQAAKELDLDLSKSFMVGDRWSDITAGQQAGCKNFFIDRGYAEKKPESPYIRVFSLLQAINFILEGI